MDNGFGVFVAAVIVLAVAVWGFVIGESSVADNCTNYGAAVIAGKRFECKQVEAK